MPFNPDIQRAERGSSFIFPGVFVSVSDGDLLLNGQLELQSISSIPYVLRNQYNSVSDLWVDSATKLERSFPIDINGNGWIDIISTVHINRYDEKRELVFYSITNKD